MKLVEATWPEVETYLKKSKGIILPVGSTEQHGPMGLIGTDALCADILAHHVSETAGAMVAPVLNYTPAEFNMAFPGTLSLPVSVFEATVRALFEGCARHGFERIYVLNAHGANLAPLRSVADTFDDLHIRIRSWWDFDDVNALRREFYGHWEGMHATPSEVAITQARIRQVPAGQASEPPRQLDASEIAARAGDRHGSALRHRKEFPDGRVGSHSALATPDAGERLIEVAGAAIAADYLSFLSG